jgi:hypothetical protein
VNNVQALLSAIIGGAIVSLSTGHVALAQTAVSDADRAVARALAEEGAKDFKAGEYRSAVDKLGRASAITKTSKLLLWYARALVKVGSLVEASERYAEASRLDASGTTNSAEQKKAQQEAESERKQLLPRIPVLQITFPGVPSGEVELSIDATVVHAALIGQPRPVNPGTHEVKARRGEQLVQQSVTVTEGQTLPLPLSFPAQSQPVAVVPAAAAVPVAPVPPPSVPQAAANPPATATATPLQSTTMAPTETKPASTAEQQPSGSSQATLGWVFLGIGGAGLAVGAVSGALVYSKKSALDRSGDCIDNLCASTQHSAVESYRTLRAVSTAGFVVGGVAAAAGLYFVLAAPNSNGVTMSAWMGPTSSGLQGRF